MYEPSEARFRFGDGTVFISRKKAVIPAEIGGKLVKIKTDVIEADIPLLLSKNAMKATNTVIHFQSDRVNMFGKQINLQFTSTGHYVIPLSRNCKIAYIDADKEDVDVCLVNVDREFTGKSAEKKKKGCKNSQAIQSCQWSSIEETTS